MNEKQKDKPVIPDGLLKQAKACLTVNTAEGDRIVVYPAPGRRSEEAVELVRKFVSEGLRP